MPALNPYFSAPVCVRGPRRAVANLAGAKGGKGGGGGTRAAREEPDSVRSKAYARIKDVVSEGPILGPIDEDGNALAADQLGRAVLLDETPLQNEDGDFNFKNVSVHFVAGTANQSYIPGFDSEESIVAVNVRAQNAGDTVVRSIANTNVDAVRVTVRIPALLKQDATNGDITGYNVQFRIAVNNNGAGWVTKVDRTVRDKISAPYLMDFRIDLEGSGPWQVRLERVSAKADTASIQSETWFDSYTEIIDGKFRHPFTSMFGLELDAEQFSSIPTVAYRIGGRIIRVPTNYNPVTRVYTGVWDGTFKLEWTDNPAWIYYDILTSKRYGLGRWITDDIVDKWALYAISVVCDTMVPDGFGGTEPLYTCNLCLEQEVDAYRALYDLASTFHGLAIWAGGSFTAVQDSPRDPVAMFTNANVEGGKFEYAGTGKDARHSHVNVWWNNPANLYKREPVFVPDEEQLLKYWNPTELTAFGCTRESQAVRRGRHLLLSEKLARKAVTFVCGLDGAHVRPNMVFKALDQYRAGKPFGGRIKTPGTTAVVLDRQVTLESGKAYTLHCVKPDGTLMTAAVVNTMTTTDSLTLNVGTPFPIAPLAQSIWLLESTSLVPALYECVGIRPEDGHPGKFRIVGVEYNASKFNSITTGLALVTNPTTALQNPRLVMPPGAVLTISEETISTPISLKVFLNVSWDASEDAYLRGYRVSWRYNQGNWQQAPESLSTNIRIETVGPGTYDFRVVSVNNLGRESGPSSGSYDLGTSSPIDNARITGIEVFGKGNDPTFEGRDCKLVWRINSAFWHELGLEPGGGDDGFMHPLFRDYVVNIYDTTTSVLLRSESVQDPSYVYTHEKNAEDARTTPQSDGSTDARRSFRVTVQVRDRYNSVSTPTSIRISNPAPSAPLATLTPDMGAAIVAITPSTDLDWAGFVVHASTTSGFTPSEANKVYDGPDTLTRIKLATGSTWYLKIAAYDAFGKTGLTYTSEMTVTPATTLDTTPPLVPTGLTSSGTLYSLADGTQAIRIVASWTANTEEDFDKYVLRVRPTGGSAFSWVYFTIAGKNSIQHEFVARPATSYDFEIAGMDRDANQSAFSATHVFAGIADTTPPAAPTSFALQSGIRIIALTWKNATDYDAAAVLIWRNTVNSFPGGDPYAVVAVRPGNVGGDTFGSFVDTQVTQGQAYYYFLKTKDTSGNITASPVSAGPGTAGLTQPTDLADWAVGLTKRFHATIALNGDIWTDNSPAGGRIAWNQHDLFFGGAKYTITAGNTPVGHKYVYWDSGSPTSYSTSATNPTLTDAQFMIATNVSGAHDLAWNALANIVVKNAFIESISADKITAGTIEAQTIVIGSGANPTNSILQSYNFIAGTSGWQVRGFGDAEFNSVTMRGAAIITGNIGASATINSESASTVATGGVRGAAALNSSNNLITAFAPGVAAPASGTGLFLGSDKMGFFTGGTWTTYMDNSGNFYLGGTSGSLTYTQSTSTLTLDGNMVLTSGHHVRSGQTSYDSGTGFFLGNVSGTPKFSIGNSGGNKLTWDGSVIAVTGTITSTSGTIGGFTLGTDLISAGSGTNKIELRNQASNVWLQLGDVSIGPAMQLQHASLAFVNSSAATVISAGIASNAGFFQVKNSSGVSKVELNGINGDITAAGNMSLTGTSAFSGDMSLTGTNKLKLNTSLTSVVYSDENWGWCMHGDASHPFSLNSCALKMNGTAGTSGSYTAGRIYFTDNVYLYESGGVLKLNDGNGDRALT